MGVVEEGGKVAEGFLASFKGQPLSLALVVTNLALLGIFYYVLATLSAQREREFGAMRIEQKEVREMLSHCIVPGQKTEVGTPAWWASFGLVDSTLQVGGTP